MNELREIPKILHHVWLGSNEIPDNLKKCLNTCYVEHLSWKHMFWTDDNLPDITLFKEEYNIDNNYARKSDIVRLAALYQHGGVYLDMDVEAVKPIDKLMEGHRFVVATEAGKTHLKNIEETHINNAVIASTKRNKTVSKLLTRMKEKYETVEIKEDDSPLSYVSPLGGPCLFNELHREGGLDGEHNKIYSHEYFYPLHYSERINGVQNWKIPSEPGAWSEKTHLVHHFAASWYDQK